MKRNIFIAVALFATMAANAQNIAVVNPSNETSVYQTLDEAVTGADPGSIIYLPGGGVQIKDETKIDKKLTIMGVSHRGDTDNADGATVIAGNLNYITGSSGSAILGVYISGSVNIGVDGTSVNNITIRNCNVSSVQVNNNSCTGVVINQNYIRNLSNYHGANVTISNNICSGMIGINGGTIINNVFTGSARTDDYNMRILSASNSVVSYNVFMGTNWTWRGSLDAIVDGSNNQGISNMTKNSDWGDECVVIGEDIDWNDIFEKNAGISIMSKYHFIGDDYTQYEGKIGIYGGSGFKDDNDAHAPIPRIVSKKVDEQTDGSGKLHIEVTIKAK